ncbi:MAG: hypothetical protein P9M13_10385 [Candidatus Ancaeobacter aquaticus]|nr:hypothetical protein [Candidatus Ancaeobacter aquaticus]
MKVSDIAVKVMPDDNDRISFAIKALVGNDSDDTEVLVELQGLDSDGFEVYTLLLEGEIPIGGSKVLTTKEDYIEKDLFDQIAEWQVK